MHKRKLAIAAVLIACIALGFVVIVRASHMMPRTKMPIGGYTGYIVTQADPTESAEVKRAVEQLEARYRSGDFSEPMTFQYDMFAPPHTFAGAALRRAIQDYYPLMRSSKVVRFGPVFHSGPHQVTVAILLRDGRKHRGAATIVLSSSGTGFQPYFVFGYQDGRGDSNAEDGRWSLPMSMVKPGSSPGFLRVRGAMPRIYPPPSPVLAIGPIYDTHPPINFLIGNRLGARRPIGEPPEPPGPPANPLQSRDSHGLPAHR